MTDGQAYEKLYGRLIKYVEFYNGYSGIVRNLFRRNPLYEYFKFKDSVGAP